MSVHLPMASLPKGYRWEVRLIQRLNSAHLSLHKPRRWWAIAGITEQKSKCSVLEVFDKPIDEIVRAIVEDSYAIRDEYFGPPTDRESWDKKGQRLAEALNVKVKVEMG